MRDSAAKQILNELLRRRPVQTDDGVLEAAEAAEQLRGFYYPKQRTFYTSSAKNRATKKTRRAGATTGGCREFIARMTEIPGFRATYVTSTKQEARERAWQNDTNNGFVDILREKGTQVANKGSRNEAYKLGGVFFEIHDQKMIITADNGGRINLFGADDERSLRKQRGLAKHVFWIDEAQDFRFLDKFYNAVISAALVDYDGECWLTGTPGQDPSGFFYDVTKDDEDDGPRIPGWEVHTFAVVDNPCFGKVIGGSSTDGKLECWVQDNIGERHGPYGSFNDAEKAATEVRWQRTAGEAIKKHGWTGNEPDLRREWYAQWVKEDARYVYPVHTVPVHQLIYGPQRLIPNPYAGTHARFDGHPPWFDVQKSLRDLPKLAGRDAKWFHAIGVDFGYHPDPFALTVWAFNPDISDVYELFSWKCTKVHTDDQGLYMKKLWDSLDSVIVFVADPAGKQDDFEMWRTRMNLPIEPANKRGKATLEEFLANDIRRKRVHLRMNSPLHMEMKHLVYMPTKPGVPRQTNKHRKSSDGVIHGDHCCDAARYAYVALNHFLAKEPIKAPEPGTEEYMRAEELRLEKHVDKESARAEALAEGDEAIWGNDYEY